MIVHPEFLQNILGHFYKQELSETPADKADSEARKLPIATASATDLTSQSCRWVLKDKAGFIQTPQDFWNVDASDPLVHSARFFYGPMLQVGRLRTALISYMSHQ